MISNAAFDVKHLNDLERKQLIVGLHVASHRYRSSKVGEVLILQDPYIHIYFRNGRTSLAFIHHPDINPALHRYVTDALIDNLQIISYQFTFNYPTLHGRFRVSP